MRQPGGTDGGQFILKGTEIERHPICVVFVHPLLPLSFPIHTGNDIYGVGLKGKRRENRVDQESAERDRAQGLV